MTTFITKVCEAWTEMNTGDRAGTLTGPGRGLIITQLTHSNVMDAPAPALRASTTLSQISSTETLSSQWHGIKRLLVMLCHCGSSFGKSNYPVKRDDAMGILIVSVPVCRSMFYHRQHVPLKLDPQSRSFYPILHKYWPTSETEKTWLEGIHTLL